MRLSTRELAMDLGLTERRVRQLVSEHIFPPAEDGFDRDLCRQRYRLYSRGPGADWRQAHDRALELAEEAEELIARALGPSGSIVDVACACESTKTLWSHLRFICAATSDTQSERAFFLSTWAHKEHDVLVALLARAQELAAQTQDAGA